MDKQKEVRYIRVSSGGQNIERQKKEGFETFTDWCSGAIPLNERPAGIKLMQAIEAGQISTVYVHSIDRLGRNVIDILETVERLAGLGVCVVSEKEGLRTLGPDGTINSTARMVLGVMASMAQFERELLKERQREGIQRAKESGRYVLNGGARRKADSPEKVLDRHSAVVKELKRGESVRRAAKLAGVSPATAQKVKKLAREAGKL